MFGGEPVTAPLCECGCGLVPAVMPKSNRTQGRVRGQHYRFVYGHNLRGGPVGQRFADAYEVDPDSGCWLWRRSLGSDGYATIRLDGGRRMRAHRFSYELLVGPIPDGLQLDHLCRVRHCVNPAHLEPVTPRENTLRGTAPSSVNAQKTHCVNGHEFSAEHTYITARGFRQCRTCVNERKRRARRNRQVVAA